MNFVLDEATQKGLESNAFDKFGDLFVDAHYEHRGMPGS